MPRWRRWMLLGVIASLVVVGADAAISARSPAPARELAQDSYLDQVLPAIQDSTQEGQDIDAVRTQAVSLGVTAVGDRLQEAAAAAGRTLDQVRRLNPPASLRSGHDRLVAALVSRADGADAFRQAMAGALSGQGPASPVAQLVDVGMDLAAGDRSYALFRSATPHLDVAVPPSTWLTDPSEYSQSEVTGFLATLGAAVSLAPVHDTAVLVVTTDPPAVSMSGQAEVLPASRLLDLQVVVADLGNQPEHDVTVSVTLTPAAGGAGQTVRISVDLVAAQRRTVDIGGLRPVVGVASTLNVTSGIVPGETSTADNVRVIPLVFR